MLARQAFALPSVTAHPMIHMATDTSSQVLAVCSVLQYQLSTTKQQQQPADDEKDQEIAALMAELAGLRAKVADRSAASDGSPPGCAISKNGRYRSSWRLRLSVTPAHATILCAHAAAYMGLA